MTARLMALCVDANDPLRLGRFWAAALRWEIDVRPGAEVDLVPTDGTPFRVAFRPVPEPKVGRNRIHLDLTTTSLDDQRESVSRLVERGAQHIDVGQGPDAPHVVLADPEGNEFCLIEPGNSFLAGCGRVGALSCDGSRQVGCFWSDALGWPLVWDQGEETAIRAPDGSGPFITWGGGPDIPKVGKNRLHLDVAPAGDGEWHAELDRLLALGATRDTGSSGRADRAILFDPDGNEFCLVRPG